MKATGMPNTSRRRFITAATVSTAGAMVSAQNFFAAEAGRAPDSNTPPATPSSLTLEKTATAVVFIDPQNDVLSEKGLSWPLVHESLKENNTIENMERIFKAAKTLGFDVFISPHYLSLIHI